MAADQLSQRELNRATLARQLLLVRSPLDPVAAATHLVGLQAQVPLDPYLALWSRLDGFDPHAVGRLVESRALVRIVVMRGTIHLVTADDALALRPVMQPVLDAEMSRHSEFAPHLVGVDVRPAIDVARTLLASEPMSGTRLRAALAERFPTLHAGALAYAARCYLPLVQVPPRGVWGRAGEVRSTPAEAWLGRPLAPATIDDVIFRYLGAFGPASVADATAWSRLTGLREVFDRLRPQLRTFRDARNRELFDLPDAPRPGPDVPAPVRFLPEYDNVLLSHADRSRFKSDDVRSGADGIGAVKGTVLVDGQVCAVWGWANSARSPQPAMVVEHVRLPARARAAVEAEARRAVAFLRPDSASEVRLVAVD